MSVHPNRLFARCSWLLAAVLVLAAAQPVLAESVPRPAAVQVLPFPRLESADAAPSPSEAPAAIEKDPAFDRYVDLTQLVEAWSEKNAVLLTDLGLQLAHGERILFRSHKSISADQVLSMAVRVAAEKKDAKTLARLARALAGLKKTELAAQVALAGKLASASRAAAPALAIPVNKITPEGLVLFRDTLDNITQARIEGDRETVDIIRQLAGKTTVFPESLRTHLVKAATEALAAVGEGKVDPAVKVLNKLVAASRGMAGVQEGTSLGVKYRVTRNGLRIVGFTKDGPTALAKGAKLNVGDLILGIGEQGCAEGASLDGLVKEAYEDEDLEVLVYVARDRKVQTYSLSTEAESGKTDEKPAGAGAKPAPK